MKIALIGGTGFVGRHIVSALRRRGFSPFVVTRTVSRGGEVGWYDVTDPVSLRRVLDGCDGVIFLPGILHGSPADFEAVHVELASQVMRACEELGIRRYLHMSALGADEQGPSHYLRSKGRAEAKVKGSSLEWTIFRPSVIFGDGDHFLSLFARLVRFAPVLPLAGARARFQPVWVEDVAAAFALSLGRADTINQCYDLVGPDVYTLAGIVRWCARIQGKHVFIVPLPDWLARWQAGVLERLPGPLMSRDNLDSMKIDNISVRDFPSLFGRQASSMEAVSPAWLLQSR